MKKIAIITGGSGGIGEAICRQLYVDGYTVIVNYANNKVKAVQLADEINGIPMRFNIADKQEVIHSICKIENDYGEIHLLVNNAGISEIDLFTKISTDMSDKILNINLKGTLNCSRIVLPRMINRKSGCIINISSMWGQCGASCEVDYSASKAGIIGFTKAIAKEVAPSGIRVNSISPGFIMTNMNRHFSDTDLDLIKEEIPLGIFGKPENIADAVSFLASDKASYITGQNLAVNGGMVI